MASLVSSISASATHDRQRNLIIQLLQKVGHQSECLIIGSLDQILVHNVILLLFVPDVVAVILA